MQFYATAEGVLHELFCALNIFEGARVLEPSAGTGNIVQRIKGRNARITAIEIHPDRGCQYCSHDYQKLLRQHGFKASMNGEGNCYDNAELIWRQSWQT